MKGWKRRVTAYLLWSSGKGWTSATTATVHSYCVVQTDFVTIIIFLADHEGQMLKKLTSSASQCSFGSSWRSLQHHSVLLIDREKVMLKMSLLLQCYFGWSWRSDAEEVVSSASLLRNQPKGHCNAEEVGQLLQHCFFMISQKDTAMLKKLDSFYNIASS